MIIKCKNYLNIERTFKELQTKIIDVLQNIDPKCNTTKNLWKYKPSGGGISCELSGGNVLEKAMVNFSSIKGNVLPNSALEKKIKGGIKQFLATGVSVVIHPENPLVPCSHMNIRFFQTDSSNKKSWWFGGGFDLTPYFVFIQDVKSWHNSAKNICDKYDKRFYPKFSKDCDEYFYNIHRKEKRGIGGVFFDNLNIKNKDIYHKFTLDIGNTFIDSYKAIVDKRKNNKYSKNQKDFQLYRRGRYVEFNLLYDRGTLFGLQSGGRADSILMSMPPKVFWGAYKNKALLSYEKKLKKYL